MKVKAWKENVIIPTYEIGEPEKNPMFFEKRVYQGSSGKVYPHPVVEKISDVKIDKTWKAFYLENDFVKIMILPELGGRIQMAYDKTKQLHFVYYNQVIKPALVGLTGPWISGGIEFNWPQHHRPSTYSPVDVYIEENEDGSKTVWCSEVEQMFRTKGMAGFTLHPDKAYLEVKVKLYNRTAQPQTFLWWANPAVKVNDEYQSVFPPDVYAVFDHGKRDVSDFPIATGTYYKVNYAPGTDISKYKNIPVPTSYMAINSDYNFVGGYENDSKGGILHLADNNISPGKKQWTWGHGEFGKAWDRNLTDEDGPYIELMCGVYTDNQPDFSWMHPFEEKTFSQYFVPYHDLGVVKNATKEALLNLEIEKNVATVKFYTLGIYKEAKILLEAQGNIYLEEIVSVSPKLSYSKEVKIDNTIPIDDYRLTLFDSQNNILVSYKQEVYKQKKIPSSAKVAELPKEIKSIEQLYLTGLHIEQYRHATYKAENYYFEALQREPKDVRCNNALGLFLLKQGQFKRAENYFNKAISTIIERNPNPSDSEAYYNLGQSLKYQGKLKEAYKAFYKSAWNAAWQDPAYFHLAQIATHNKDFQLALELIDKSLIRNWHNHKARALKAAILRKLGKIKTALKFCEESLEIDRFNFGVLFEHYLISSDITILKTFNELIRGNIHNYIEYGLDYVGAGLFDEAIKLLNEGLKIDDTNPIAHYFYGWFQFKIGKKEKALAQFTIANEISTNCNFAYRLEVVEALKCAIDLQKTNAKANFQLGNFWYDKKQYMEAIKCWETSKEIDNAFPTVRRNLALAYFNKENNTEKALIELKKAFDLDSTDARVLMELDQLCKRLNHTQQSRLSFLEKHFYLVNFRDDLFLEYCTLYNQLGNYNEALELISSRKFHPWEGGEGKVPAQYLLSLTELAKESIRNNNYEKAIEFLEKTKKYPHNLGEGKLTGAQENDIHYWLGCAFEGLGEKEKANYYWTKASKGLSEASAAIYYNDQQPDKIFYQGLAYLKLGNIEEANTRFKGLINYGEKHISDTISIDYFAVSLPEMLIWDANLNENNEIHCRYLKGLGFLGLQEIENAAIEFTSVLNLNSSHGGVQIHIKLLKLLRTSN
ncbi:MAG: DUF5107 domain-containing protein [Cellulophaga sp.]